MLQAQARPALLRGFGIAALALLVGCWDLLSRALGREVTPGFMGEVMKSAQADGALWLLVIAFCVAAPVWEEIFARGFLYRGWSESRLGVAGAIFLSSLAWTSLHLQYDWFFSEDQTEFVVRERYTDSNAVFAHLANLGDLFGKILQVSDFSVEVYGNASQDLRDATASMNSKFYSFYQGL